MPNYNNHYYHVFWPVSQIDIQHNMVDFVVEGHMKWNGAYIHVITCEEFTVLL